MLTWSVNNPTFTYSRNEPKLLALMKSVLLILLEVSLWLDIFLKHNRVANVRLVFTDFVSGLETATKLMTHFLYPQNIGRNSRCLFFFPSAAVSFRKKYVLKEWENNEKINSLDMTQLTCDKLMKSDGSIKTFRANKVCKAVKSWNFSFTLFNYSKYHHPPPSQNVSAVCLTTEKEWQRS